MFFCCQTTIKEEYLKQILFSYQRTKQENQLVWKKKIKRGEDTKKKIIEWVEAKYPKDFVYELTSYGNPKPGTDDKADAVVIALAGLSEINS